VGLAGSLSPLRSLLRRHAPRRRTHARRRRDCVGWRPVHAGRSAGARRHPAVQPAEAGRAGFTAPLPCSGEERGPGDARRSAASAVEGDRRRNRPRVGRYATPAPHRDGRHGRGCVGGVLPASSALHEGPGKCARPTRGRLLRDGFDPARRGQEYAHDHRPRSWR
jgi:hypothetical protein